MTAWAGELTPIEARAEVDCLEDLQARRRAILEANDRLIALHGSFGLFDNFRKKMLEAQKVRVRMELAAAGKPTEAMIDAAAHGCEDYARFMDTALEEKIAWLHVDNELTEIEEKIRARDQGIGEHIKAMGLQR